MRGIVMPVTAGGDRLCEGSGMVLGRNRTKEIGLNASQRELTMSKTQELKTEDLRTLSSSELDLIAGGRFEYAPATISYGPPIGDWQFKDVFAQPVLGRYTPR